MQEDGNQQVEEDQVAELLGPIKLSQKRWRRVAVLWSCIVLIMLIIYVVHFDIISPSSVRSGVIAVRVKEPEFVVIDAASTCSLDPSVLAEKFKSSQVSLENRRELLKELVGGANMRSDYNVQHVSMFHNLILNGGPGNKGFDTKEKAIKGCEQLPIPNTRMASASEVSKIVRDYDVQWWDYGWVSDGSLVAPLHPSHQATTFRTIRTDGTSVQNPQDGEYYPSYCMLSIPTAYSHAPLESEFMRST